MRQNFFLVFIILTAKSCQGQGEINDSQQWSVDELKPQLEFFQSKVVIPSDFKADTVSLVEVNKEKAYLFRYTKDVNSDLLQEHFSFIVTQEMPYRILGFTRMDVKYLDRDLLSEEQTREIATKFLLEIDADLANSLENLWIDKHGESMVINQQEKLIFGMKYKCYRKSRGDYAWVIVGFDGSVITFERDIIWDNAANKRITQKWLHDSWILENDKKQQDVKG